MRRFVITRRTNNEYQFNLKASNGETILTSEGYVQKGSCMNGIESVKVNSLDDSKYERKLATNGKSFFVLKAGNGQIIGKSQLYSSAAAMEKGIASVKENASDANISDQTSESM